jgi:hypothetical protein
VGTLLLRKSVQLRHRAPTVDSAADADDVRAELSHLLCEVQLDNTIRRDCPRNSLFVLEVALMADFQRTLR